jgi:hypothetical protein
MNIFSKLYAGDSANWHDDPRTIGGVRYSSADWLLTYELRGPTVLTLVAVADSDGWRTSITPEQSSALQAGSYLWGAFLTRPGERKTAETGALVVEADLTAVAAPIDARTPAQKALADCEAALATFNSSGGKVKSYTIGTRQTEFHSLQDLMAVRRFWARRVQAEQRHKRQLLVSFR